MMIRGTSLEGAAGFCGYVFWLSCASPGTVGFWNITVTNNDDGDAPDYDFDFLSQNPSSDSIGDLPFSETDPDTGIQSGFSDDDGTLFGYAAYPDAPPGVDAGELPGWAEACYVQIRDLKGGFASFVISCIPWSPETQAMTVDPDEPLTLDITASIDCPPPLNISTNNAGAHSPGDVWLNPDNSSGSSDAYAFFYLGAACRLYTGSGGEGDLALLSGQITSARILAGHVDYTFPDSGGSSGGCCITDQLGCAPTIPPDCITNSWDLPAPVNMVENGTYPGHWSVALTDIGMNLDGLGLGSNGGGVGTFIVQTNLGLVTWIVADHTCY